MTTVLVLGTMDTKAAEYEFAIDQLQKQNLDAYVVDVGVLDDPLIPVDVSAQDVAAEAAADLSELRRLADRGHAVEVMAQGAAVIAHRLHDQGRIHAAIALGGTGGTSLAAHTFRSLPLGVPKVILSTAASGETSQYIRESDLILVPSIVDIAGVNRVSSMMIQRAVGALAGMLKLPHAKGEDHLPLVAASMFGVTTECVTAARAKLEDLGYETLTFHMTGTGGRALESLVREGAVVGVLDVTTTELADELVGGVFSAGPDRLTSAAANGTPQVVAPGALDMVNFGPLETVPPKFRHRNLHVHNASVTLMRTTPEECAVLGGRLAERVRASRGPAAVLLPIRGISALAMEGGVFHDPDADAALFAAIRTALAGSAVDLIEIDAAINDQEFATACVRTLDALLSQTT